MAASCSCQNSCSSCGPASSSCSCSKGYCACNGCVNKAHANCGCDGVQECSCAKDGKACACGK
ncbi:hypothetical protein OH77DRAFT_1420208 [Trametes cingulata]|nr:hypothetical protein OH77DRAFT_1420208 [Trametes cingulata]